MGWLANGWVFILAVQGGCWAGWPLAGCSFWLFRQAGHWLAVHSGRSFWLFILVIRLVVQAGRNGWWFVRVIWMIHCRVTDLVLVHLK